MGFLLAWVSRIMHFVIIIFYSIMINGEPNDLITPTRGIR